MSRGLKVKSGQRLQSITGYEGMDDALLLSCKRSLITVTIGWARCPTAMEMRRYRKILRISYKDRVTNEEARAKIQQAIRQHEDLLTIVKRDANCSGMVLSPVQ